MWRKRMGIEPTKPLLAQSFIDRHAKLQGKAVEGLSSQAAQKLLDYEWPGNVRELENCIERAVTLTRFENLTVPRAIEG